MESTTETVLPVSIHLPKFGPLTYSEADVIETPWGLPGFTAHRRWLFLTLDSQPNFVWLQSLDDLNVALPTANPWMMFEDYAPEVPAYGFAVLEINEAAEFTYLCVMRVSAGAAEMTMNLRAPIVVNLRTRKAVQVSLDDDRYSNAEPIPRKFDEAVLSAKAS
jgi:flagellar assembly factor FliW